MPVLVSPVVVRAGSSAVPAANVDTPVTPSVVPTVAAPVIVAEPAVTSPVTLKAPVAVGEDERMLFTLILLVVPDAAIVKSLTSTIGIASLIGSAAVNTARDVIFTSAILVNC
jgi:hypothetical protein